MYKREAGTTMKFPYVFMDTDSWSSTFGKWCIRWSEIFSEDGFDSKQAALDELAKG